MKKYGKLIGLLGGLLLCIIICLSPIEGLSREGRLCLGFTLMTVIWWAAQVVQSGYVSGIYLMLLCLFEVAKPDVIFAGWTGSSIWLVVGAYLIASAVQKSGLGKRLSYIFVLRFVRTWKSIIISIFALTFVLSLLIPHPWPRAFLVMSVMRVLIQAAHIPKRESTIIGFSVFAASVPISLIFMTGDATINPLAASYASSPVSFVDWFIIMGVPAIVLSLLTLILLLIFFKPSVSVNINLEEIREEKAKLGKMQSREIRTIVWMGIAILLWLTNGITGLDIGWITLMVAMLMSLPVVGEVVRAEDWKEVPVHVMVFLTAAIAIGKVGGVTGMNQWIASTFMPSSIPENIIVFVLLIAGLTMIIHMFMGSVIAVMGVVIPALIAFTEPAGIPSLAVIGIVYLSVAGHYILPFHHLNMLVGQGEENGMYTQKETVRLGLPLCLAIFIMVIFAVGWWKLIGLL